MDKQTLSHYGWIIIIVLILAVMLAFATPFGKYIGKGVSNLAMSMVGANDKAVDKNNIEQMGKDWHNYLNNIDPALNPSGTVPDSAIYMQYINGSPVYHYDPNMPDLLDYGEWLYDDIKTYQADSTFPTPKLGDRYTYGDYEYCYGFMYCVDCYSWCNECGCFFECDGWAVRCMNDVAEPGAILESINGKLVTCMEYAFYECTSLTTAPKIPDGVTNMSLTFSECSSLTTVPVIPNSVTIMNDTFAGCTSLTTAPVIPNSVTYMGGAFYKCTSLKTYVGSKDPDGDFSGYKIPNSVTNMQSTFNDCTSLTTAPVIPNSVTNMLGTFHNCTALTTAPVIPGSVTDMGHTFNGCTNLKTYVGSKDPDGDFSGYIIPSSVKEMYYTFYNCTLLTTAPVIPSSVYRLQYAFDGCNSLTGAIEINSTPTEYYGCLKGTQITEILGDCTIKDKILATK